MAATGAIFDARRAGNTDEATLTPSPATSEAMIALFVSTIPPLGRSRPIPSSSACNPAATPIPAARPRTDAISPTTAASRTTAPIT